MTRPIHQTSPERESKVDSPLPGIPFEATVCICRECERLLTASDSVLRGTGPTCYAKEQRARFVDPRQLALPWEQEARG